MLMISYYFLLQVKNCKHVCISKKLRFCEEMEAPSEHSHLPVSLFILVKNANEIYYFNEQFVDTFDTPKNSKLDKISSLNFMCKKSYLSQYLMDSNKEELKILVTLYTIYK